MTKTAGTIKFAYYDAELGRDRVVTIDITDPDCHENPQTRKLIKNVRSAAP